MLSYFALFTYLRSPTSFSSCFKSPTYLLFCLMLTLVLGSLAVLLLLPMLSLAPSHIASIALRTLKQVLSDGRLRCYSTSLVQFLCLFLFFDLFSNKTNNKQAFDKAFINCRLFTTIMLEKRLT